ncbi:kelch-like protein 38 [Arctopsyche grandis]|uniref:kelch-like protein 38 n=1 Tax=Arctopsyche grandis TaxID=121162 RepID=UPI00406D9BF9
MIEVRAKPGFASKNFEYLYDAMKERKLTDVTFTVGNQNFFAHLVVLSACSEFFYENRYKLSAVFSEYNHTVIEAILKYCYTGKTNIENKHFKNFMKLAEKLQIKSIAPQFETIDATNCVKVLSLSDDPNLREQAMSLTIDIFKNLYKNQEIVNLPVSTLTDILKSDKLNVSPEEIFESVKLWVKSDETNRSSELVDLLSFVKLPSLSLEFLFKQVLVFCSPYAECIELLQRAIESIFLNCQSKLSISEQNLKNFQSKFSMAELNLNHCQFHKIALIGDFYSSVGNIIDVYDGRKNSWSLCRNFSFNRDQFASVLVKEEIMIIGGNPYYTQVDYVDLKDGQKHSMKPLNQGRRAFSAVALHHLTSSDVYAIGGEYQNRHLSSVERWNSKTMNWDENVAPLLLAVCYHSASIIDDRIYVTGGRKRENKEETSINSMQVYSVDSNSWSYGTPMIQAREHHSSIAIKGKLYVGGGMMKEAFSFLNVSSKFLRGVSLDSVESYDPITKVWTDFCTLPTPASGISLCFFQNKLLSIGGHDTNTSSNNVWEYDDESKSWRALQSLNEDRYLANAIVLPGYSTI